jgi:hypothetical protein
MVLPNSFKLVCTHASMPASAAWSEGSTESSVAAARAACSSTYGLASRDEMRAPLLDVPISCISVFSAAGARPRRKAAARRSTSPAKKSHTSVSVYCITRTSVMLSSTCSSAAGYSTASASPAASAADSSAKGCAEQNLITATERASM